jgi:hypothetical protein
MQKLTYNDFILKILNKEKALHQMLGLVKSFHE